MNQLFVSNAPWIVGRPALLEYALEDFLGELGRQRPWTRSHVQDLLESLNVWLEVQMGQPVILEQLQAEHVTNWLETLDFNNRSDARLALGLFAEYVLCWGWLESCGWLVVAENQS
jgi:hypothetical protein